MTPLERRIAVACLIVISLLIVYWVLLPHPVRAYREITPQEKARAEKAIKYHGDYLIESMGDNWVMLTPKGKIKI